MKNFGLFIFLVALLLGGLGVSRGQQDAQYTQYMYNTVAINPAYAGNRGVMSILGLHRSQWVGLEGAPRTQSLSVHSPVGLSRVGLGLSIVNDALGPAQETYANVDFSYTVNTSDVGRLSFGIKTGLHLLDVDYTKLTTQTPEFTAENNIDNKVSPNIGTGVYYHTDRFYLGLSVPNLLTTDHFDEGQNSNSGSSSLVAKERLHYYGIAGYTFDLSSNLKFKPSTMVKGVSGAPLQVDVSANFLLYERVTLGAAYRWSAALSGMVGFQISDGMLLGFAYDRETTELGDTKYNDGSYEVFLRFELFRDYDKMITPRFF